MSRPWMPLYVGDYLKDTRRLSTVEHGAYMLLIMEYWIKGGLPDDDRKLARVVGLSEAEWMDVRDNLAELFLPGWRHKRIDDEIEKTNAKNERRAEAGRRGGLAKAKQNPSNASRLPEQNSSNALASSSQSETTIVVSSSPRDREDKPPKGTRLSPDWQPRPEDCGENARTELPKFRDYWLAVPGAKGVKLDWDATWRNWQRNARPVSRAGPSGRKADAYSEIFLELNNLSQPHDPFADYAPEYEFGGEPAGNVRRIGQGR